MIEQLTETNLNLESKIEELEAQVADLVIIIFFISNKYSLILISKRNQSMKLIIN
jgi:hypothetical protein